MNRYRLYLLCSASKHCQANTTTEKTNSLIMESSHVDIQTAVARHYRCSLISMTDAPSTSKR
eukprot:103961-Amphidinium_carterae.1